jgi:hypothetical protein
MKRKLPKNGKESSAPFARTYARGITWKELNQAISKVMQNYCGGIKEQKLLQTDYPF